MTSPISIGRSGLYRDAASPPAEVVDGKRWPRRKCALFVAGVCTLSWLLVASPFIIWS